MKKFVITGGHFENKGAQAMLLAVIEELRARYPNSEIWAFTQRPIKQNDLVFDHLPWDGRVKIRLFLGKLRWLVGSSSNKESEKRIINVLSNADMVFDVSGFALSSQFGYYATFIYLMKIAIMKKFKCQIILLPQSFGPFNYKNIFLKIILLTFMKWYLRYPKKIFAREEQGYNAIKKYTFNNLQKSVDVVLQSKNIPREMLIQSKVDYLEEIHIDKKSVAIIPNIRNLKFNSLNNIYYIYKNLITSLVREKYNVYILRHSYDDLDLCYNLYKEFDANPQVEFFDKDYSCIEVYEIISRMEFVIASRYHSLIHAYKSGVPAIVIGWAEKYKDVMSKFEQVQYYFDIRIKIDIPIINNALIKMISRREIESKLINTNRTKLVNENNVFEIMLKNL